MSFKTVSDSYLLRFYHPRVGMLIIYKALTQWLKHSKSSITLDRSDRER